MYKIQNHRLVGVPFEQAEKVGKVITPTIIVVHDTASSLVKYAAANYLRKNDRGVSVHLVVERDGTPQQQVDFNRQANHAGQSIYNGREFCNGFSIGIEIVNPGIMTKGPTPDVAISYGKEYNRKEYDIHEAKALPNGGMGIWMNYTPEQIATVKNLVAALVKEYPSIKDVVPHWFISPGRKVDTNPLFPLQDVKNFAFGAGGAPADDETPGPAATASGKVKTLVDDLNLRKWPSFNDNVLAQLDKGTELVVIKSGTFDDGGKKVNWLQVSFNGQKGWIVDRADYVSKL